MPNWKDSKFWFIKSDLSWPISCWKEQHFDQWNYSFLNQSFACPSVTGPTEWRWAIKKGRLLIQKCRFSMSYLGVAPLFACRSVGRVRRPFIDPCFVILYDVRNSSAWLKRLRDGPQQLNLWMKSDLANLHKFYISFGRWWKKPHWIKSEWLTFAKKKKAIKVCQIIEPLIWWRYPDHWDDVLFELIQGSLSNYNSQLLWLQLSIENIGPAMFSIELPFQWGL